MGGNGQEEWRGEKRGEEKRGRVPVAFSEMLIDVVKTVRNEPTLSPLIKHKHTPSTDDTNTCTHTQNFS